MLYFLEISLYRDILFATFVKLNYAIAYCRLKSTLHFVPKSKSDNDDNDNANNDINN